MTTLPDIVLLVLDTQRLDRLSCYGYRQETTPYLDKLAQDATLYRHAYATAQWTVPSHASMFTGLYPDQHTMLHASSLLPGQLPTLAERLGQAGYFTAAFCNNPLIGVVNTGLQRGFHSFLNYSGLMTSRPHQSGDQKHLLDRYRQHFKRFLANGITGLQDIFAHSDLLLDLSFSPLMAPLWQTALSFKGNTAKSLNDAASLHIERKGIEQGQPVFSFINLMGVHMPYHATPRFRERFAPRVQQDRHTRQALQHFNSDVFGWMAPLTSALDAKDYALLSAMYDAEVAFQDELVGTFLEQLRASGVLDRSLLIICADHGEHLGEKQLMGHSIAVYNTLVHVPLLIRDPAGAFPRGTTSEQVVSTRRIFHTALTAAEQASDAEQAYTLAQSVSSDPDQQRIFASGVTPQNLLNVMQRRRPDLIEAYHCDQPRQAVWQGRYKLIKTGEEKLELYDVYEDPDELIDLCSILPEQVEELQAAFVSEDRNQFKQQVSAAANLQDDPVVRRRLYDLGYLE
ncbi:sulfatase [Dictyobacter alpinus]|uniref:Sulfatase n=1 Tax=Dictyobacter alpinus TaxID=2014873 RepID=A0A402B3S5_9CHLR|nr:sulfatase [Dictyobacter alpinus]GCE25957.1 sulfatase [Dictyobacter alpinus]